MPTYYVDPTVASSGNGLSAGAAFKTYGEVPDVLNLVVRWRGDGVMHRPSASLPLNLTGRNIGKTFTKNNVTHEVYGEGNPTITGAVVWGGAVGSQTVNGLPCKTINAGREVLPFWFPRVDRKATYPSLCAPTGNDSVDTFAVNPAAFDDIANLAAGIRFCPASNYGGNSDSTKEVSYTYDSSRPDTSRYHIKIKAPGFWARANAVVPLVGHWVVCRTGPNFTDYFCKIISYDAGDGSVVIAAAAVPNGGTTGTFFYGLIAHKYGLRQNRQYAAIMSEGLTVGWVFKMPDGAIDIACYSVMLCATADTFLFEDGKTWRFEANAHGNRTPYGGSAVSAEQGVNNFRLMDAEAVQLRNFERGGAVLRGGTSGAITNFTVGRIVQRECMGVKLFEIAATEIGGAISATGPMTSESGGGGLRVAGGGNGIVIADAVITPRASIHDNGGNIYSAFRDVEFNGVVIVGAVNPWATQFNQSGGAEETPFEDVNRRLINSFISGRPKIDLSDYQTSSIMRNDNGNLNGLYDRVIAVGGSSNTWGDDGGTKPNTGMVVQRSVIDKIGKASTAAAAFSGMTFRHCVFPKNLRGSSPTIAEYIATYGGTVESCVELADPYAGTITNDMWDKLTLNDDFSGHEDLPWLAPQLGLTIPAYGSARTLVKPAFVGVKLYVGHQSGMMIGTLLNPNPLAVMSLPPGLGDNDKLEPLLFGGINVIPARAIPDQARLDMVVRVTDAGATNGPYQDFVYSLPIESFSEGIQYGPFTLSVTDSLGSSDALEEFFITVAA